MPARMAALAAAFTALSPIPALAQSNVPGAVETQQLSALDVWSVSALTRGNGALAPDLWRQSDPAFLAALFDRLPTNYESPAAQALADRKSVV